MTEVLETEQAVIDTILNSKSYDQRSKVEHNSRFDEDLGIDSLARIDLVVALEKQFNVLFEESELADVSTVGDLVRVVDNALGK